jgi:hypothetical protein
MARIMPAADSLSKLETDRQLNLPHPKPDLARNMLVKAGSNTSCRSISTKTFVAFHQRGKINCSRNLYVANGSTFDDSDQH